MTTCLVQQQVQLDKNFGDSAADWVKCIESGEKADAFKQLIRNTAKLGLPDKVAGLLDQGIDLEPVPLLLIVLT